MYSCTKTLLLCLLAGSCASVPSGGPAAERPDRRTQSVSTEPSRPVDAAGYPTSVTPISAAAGFDAADLAIWNDPEFKRRFTESYLSEVEIEPRVTVVEREQLEEVFDLIANERVDRAVALLEKRRGDATTAVFDFTLGNLAFQRDDLEQAVVEYEVAVGKFPKFRRAWGNLALARARGGDFSGAAQAFSRVVALGGGDAATYGLLGISCLNLRKHVAAESAFRMAALMEPQRFDWQMGLAESLFKQGRYADVVALTDVLIGEHPDRAELWTLQATAYVGLEKPLEAAEDYELVDRLGASTVDSLNNLGDIYVNEELFDLGVDSFVRAMEKDPEASPARALRAAKVLTARGARGETRRLVEAIEASYGERLEAEQRKDLLKLRARLAVAEGASDEEARVLEEIVALDPLDGEALILLGQHAGRAGEHEKAIFYYERAESLEEFEADAKVRHAQLLVGLGRYGEALPLLRRAQVLKPRENIQQYLEQVERVAQAR